MTHSEDLLEWVDRQLGLTQDHLDRPLDHPGFPSPDFWKGYKSALESVRYTVEAQAMDSA